MDKATENQRFLTQAIYENVEMLTKPQRVVVASELENGEIVKTEVQTSSLLEQLQDAVQSTQIYGSNRGASLANTRNVLDLSALVLLGQITEELDDMRHDIGDFRPRRPDLEDAIRQFYVHLQLAVEHDPTIHLSPVLKKMTGWVNAINVKFDPPVVLDITKPCPKCAVEHVFDDYGDRHRAVIIGWRKTFDKSRAECRACGQTWVGESELRQLRWDIDEREDDTSEDS
jgi:hypothetical protein